MAGAGGTGIGLGIMGGILGGIGDIMASTKYKRPSVPQPGGQEQRLRSLAQGQLIGGGLESLAGTQLFNQLSPLMLGMVPGMSVTPAAAGGAAGGAGGAAGGGAGAGGTPMMDYQTALANYQNTIGRNQQIQNLQDQLKAMPKGPEKRGVRQQLKGLKKQQKGAPTAVQAERDVYKAGTTTPQFTVSGTAQQPGPVASDLSPGSQSTLAQILGWMHGAQDAATSGATPPSLAAGGSFLSDYRNALNPDYRITTAAFQPGLPPSGSAPEQSYIGGGPTTQQQGSDTGMQYYQRNPYDPRFELNLDNPQLTP